GAVRVAEQALEAGASALAVALLEEALELREAGIKAPILVFGWVAPEDTPIAAANHLTLTCFQKEWLQDVAAYTFEKPLNVHMKWDTGMGRVGIRTEEELHALLECLKGLSQVKLTGVYTHFSTADEADLTHFNEQRRRFNRLLTAFQKQWEAPVTVHTGNSAAAMRFPEHMYHYVRFGIGMYGLYPSAIVKNEQTIALQPAFSLQSRLVHIKKVAQTEPIRYGATYRTPHPEWIGTVPIGYADGWARKLQGMDVLIDGQRMPITGRICMEDRKSTRLNSSHVSISYAVFCLKKKKDTTTTHENASRHADIHRRVLAAIQDGVINKQCGAEISMEPPLPQQHQIRSQHRLHNLV